MIVSSVRRVGNVAGKVLDADDRRVIGQGMVLIFSVAFCLLTLGFSAGLAVRVFGLVSGG